MAGGSRAGRLIERLLTPWLSSVYRDASKVVVIAPTMGDILQARGVDPDKIEVVYNWAHDHVPAAIEQREPRGDGPVRMLYAGNLGAMQDLETVVRAVANFDSSEATLMIAGDGTERERLEALVADLGAENVTFLGRLTPEEVGALYAQVDFSLVTLRDLPNFRGTIPSKLQASVAAGLPVITTVTGDAADLVAQGAGFVANPESVESLAGAIREAINQSPDHHRDMREAAYGLYLTHFQAQAALDRITSIMIDASEDKVRETR